MKSITVSKSFIHARERLLKYTEDSLEELYLAYSRFDEESDDEWRSFFNKKMAHMYDVMGIKPMRLYDVEWIVKRNADFPERVGQKNSIHAMITRAIM